MRIRLNELEQNQQRARDEMEKSFRLKELNWYELVRVEAIKALNFNPHVPVVMWKPNCSFVEGYFLITIQRIGKVACGNRAPKIFQEEAAERAASESVAVFRQQDAIFLLALLMFGPPCKMFA